MLKEINLFIGDGSASAASLEYELYAWIIYQSFDSPSTDSVLYLFNKLTAVASAYGASLDKLIAAGGTDWKETSLNDFYLTGSPTNNGYV